MSLPLSSIKYNKLFQYKKVSGRITSRFVGLELQDGYYHPFISFNKFDIKKKKIPTGYTRKGIGAKNRKKWYCDKDRKQLMLNNEYIAAIRADNHGAETYAIHDNGGRPFVVYCNQNCVRIYKMPENGKYYYETDWDEAYYIDFICQYSPQKVFIGEDLIYDEFKGNTILLSLGENKYVSIGNCGIYEFIAVDEIVEYRSKVGNSDVPYPYAVGTDNIYFILEKCYVDKKLFENITGDPYMYLYGHRGDGTIKKNKQPLSNVKIIHDRI